MRSDQQIGLVLAGRIKEVYVDEDEDASDSASNALTKFFWYARCRVAC
jgi:hypothetical protein